MTENLDFVTLLRILVNARVKMVVIGGVAITLRAGYTGTVDLDLCFERSPENVELLSRTLAPYCPAIRSAFTDTISLLSSNPLGEKFSTAFGDVDLLGEVSGLGDYEQVLANATPIKVDNVIVNVLTVDGLIKAKEAANREKDKPHLVELRALKEMLKQQKKPDSEV